MVNIMKKLVTAASLVLFSLSAHALPSAGFSDVTDNGGGSYTFTFDTLPGPDIINNDGLTFSGFGLNLTVTGSSTVIQDVPSNGGLGVNGGANGDNMGGGEWLNFSFGSSIDLLDFTLNGLMTGDGHQDAADGNIVVRSAGGGINGPAGFFDGVGTDWTDTHGYLADQFSNFSDINSFKVTTIDATIGDGWHGYVESITVRTASVPEPSLLALLSIGLVGIGFARRKV